MNIRSSLLAIAAALVLPLAAGCSKETTEAAGTTASSAAKDLKELGGKAAEAVQQIPAQLEALKKSADEKMPAVETAIADLEKKAAAKSGDAKVQLEELIRQIGAKKDEIAKAVAELDLKSMSADTYNAAKAKVEPMLADLSKMLEKAKSM